MYKFPIANLQDGSSTLPSSTKVQIINSIIKKNNMKTKEIKISIPEGYEIDKENSTFDCIKFKSIKTLSIKELLDELFLQYEKVVTYLSTTSYSQVAKLHAINALLNVSKYLNGDWKPDWNNSHEEKYSIYITKNNSMDISRSTYLNDTFVYFKNEELAQQAIEILGEKWIRLALSTDW